jgi:thioredoxin-like negative regulator of GroEL
MEGQKHVRRRLTLVSILALLIAGVGQHPAAAKKIDQLGTIWYTTLPEGLQAAAAEGKPVFLDFWHASSKAYKRQFDETYKDPRVKAMFSQFILVTLNIVMENATAQAFHVNQIPAVVFLDPTGKELGRHRVEQFVSADLLVERMESVLGDLKAFNELKEKIQREANRPDLVLKMGQVLEGWLWEPEAIACYKNVAEATSADRKLQDQAKEGWSRSLLAFGNRSGLRGDHATAIRCLRDFLTLFPKHEMATEAEFMLAMHLIQTDQTEEARKILTELKQKTKGDEKKRAEAVLKALPQTN